MSQSDFLFGPRVEGDRTLFRLWAPSREAVELMIKDQPPIPMQKGEDGFFSVGPNVGVGTRYRFASDGLEFPDPASRQQDGDTRGWSVVRDDQPVSAAQSRPWHETVLCEVHVGAATPEGTFSALATGSSTSGTQGTQPSKSCPSTSFPARETGAMTARSSLLRNPPMAHPTTSRLW